MHTLPPHTHTQTTTILSNCRLPPNTSVWRTNGLRWSDCCGGGNHTHFLPKTKGMIDKDWLPDKQVECPLWGHQACACPWKELIFPTELLPLNNKFGSWWRKPNSGEWILQSKDWCGAGLRDLPGNLFRILVNEGFVLSFWEGELRINLPNTLHLSSRNSSFTAYLPGRPKTMWQSCWKWAFRF